MIDRKFLVDAQVWKITDGEPQELKVDDKIFVLKPITTHIISKSKKHTKHNVKMSYLEKWIIKGDFEFFTLDQFFKVFPKQRYNDKLTYHISNLISRKIISEPSKDKFQVIRIK